jgi:hypothetical protein
MSTFPTCVLGDRLARARRDGQDFHEAWPPALADALRLVAGDPEELKQWHRVLVETLPVWRAAYDRAPATRRDRALALVADPADREPLPERACALCGRALPADAHRNRRYCSDLCRRSASDGRPHRQLSAA